MRICFFRLSCCLVLGYFMSTNLVWAQDETILFGVADPGNTASIPNWGVNTLSTTDIQRDLLFMGSNTVNFVLVAFQAETPQTNNSLISSDITVVTNNIIAASMVPTTNWVMSFASGAGVNSWYQSGAGTVYPNLWATNMEVWQRYYHHSMLWTMPFNEPDYGPWGEGSAQNLHDIMVYLQASTNYAGSTMAGPTTLDDDNALPWFSTISPPAAIGTTHCLAGSAAGYANFIQSVTADNAMPINPEAHNLGEAVMGANYGLKGVAWWGPAELARGSFANACKGKQLGYADDLNNWTAAAIYRGTNGAVQAFLGGSERMAVTTSYRFFSRDRDVFYNGYGPQRAYDTAVPGGNGYQVNQPDMEQVLNITWGSDVQPSISGSYVLVNRNSGKVLEVPGASTNNGIILVQDSYTGASNQIWSVCPIPATFGGDASYYTLVAEHDGVTADETGYSFNNGNPIQQWNGGTNTVEQWYFEYVGTNNFRIHSRWSSKCIGVLNGSGVSGAQIVQSDIDGTADQLWRLIPVGAPIQFSAPGWPSTIAATANQVSVQVTWSTNFEPAGATYTVLRSTNSVGSYAIVARGLTNSSFIDKSANQPVTYYYKMEATDRSMNVSAMSPAVSATPSCGPAAVAYYTFDTTFADSSGNANDVIVTNGSPTFAAGKFGSALGLNGTNQNVMLPAGMLASVTNFTIAAWVYWNGGAAWQRIFDFGNGTSQYMLLTPDSGSGTLRFAITTNYSGGEQIVETTPLASNQWVHVAITYNGITASLYTNGILATSGAIAITPASFNPALNYLGKSQYPGDPAFSGSIGDFLVANYAMSAAQIAWLPIGNSPLPALAHRYSFNEPSGSTTITDSVGGVTWNGTLPNGGTFGNGQLSFASTSQQYVNLPGGIVSNDAAATIDMWIPKISGATNSPPFVYLFSFGNTDGSGAGYDYIFFNPNFARAVISAADPGYYNEQGGNLPASVGVVTNLHLTCVFDPPDGIISVYTNGALASTFAGITDPLSVVGNQFAYIGRSLYTGDAYLSWSIQELRIYSGAMSAADVAGSQIAGPGVLLTTNVALTPAIGGHNLKLNWPVAGSGFTLVSSPTLGSGAVWTPELASPSVNGGNYQFSIPETNGTMFFRLQR